MNTFTWVILQNKFIATIFTGFLTKIPVHFLSPSYVEQFPHISCVLALSSLLCFAVSANHEAHFAGFFSVLGLLPFSTSKYLSWHSESLSLCAPINPLNAELNPICYLLALLAHHFHHVSRISVKSLTLRLLMSYIWSAYSWCF